MTDTTVKNSQSVVEEVGLTDWIKSEPEDDTEESELTWESLSQIKDSSSRGKRKRGGNRNNQIRPNKSLKTKEPQDLSESEQISLQSLTEDEYIIAYIKEEEIKEEVDDSSITELPSDAHLNQNHTLPAEPEIKNIPKSPPQPVSTESEIPKTTFPKADKVSHPQSTVKFKRPTVIIKLPRLVPGLSQGLFTPTLTSSCTYPCPVCSGEYVSIIKLTIHLGRHSIGAYKGSPFTCLICSTIYASSEELFRHLASVCLVVPPILIIQYPVMSPRIIPIIREVPKVSAPTIQAVPPIPNTSGKWHICPHCKIQYASQGNLLRHITKYHNDNPQPPKVAPRIRCPHCSATFSLLSTYKQHYTLHHDPTNVLINKDYVSLKETTKVTLEKLISTDGPTLDSLAKKLGIAPASDENTGI